MTGSHPQGSSWRRPPVAIVHDHIVQRGGAERVLLAITRCFPDAPVITSVYEPELTYPEFRDVDVRPMWINRIAPVRRHHRVAFPIMAAAFGRVKVPAAVTISSSSGWSHGVRAEGRKLVYCYNPPRWLYQPRSQYLGRSLAPRLAAGALRRHLLRWDQAASASAEQYLAISSTVRERIRTAYGREARVVPPPQTIDAGGARRPLPGIEPGFLLAVSRLLPYKNLDPIIDAVGHVGDGTRLVVAGAGPDLRRLRERAGPGVRLTGGIDEAELRWLYANCRALVAASYEDFGLTPLEAAAFGKPSIVLRWGGFFDTVVEGRTGVFFNRPEAGAIAGAMRDLRRMSFDPEVLRAHAAGYAEAAFGTRLREAVAALSEQPAGAR